MTPPRILVAGVGNIFRGDDAFGVEVVARLAEGELPASVRIADFGIRGHDLAYAILDGYDVVVIVDATCRGGAPGTVYKLELPAGEEIESRGWVLTHGVDLPAVFALVRSMGGTFPPLYLVGCEPADLGTEDEGAAGLSEPVQAAVERAVRVVRTLLTEWSRA